MPVIKNLNLDVTVILIGYMIYFKVNGQLLTYL